MKNLVLTLCAWVLLGPSLAVAAETASTVLVYQGKHKTVGHEFAQGSSRGGVFKKQDEAWLVIELTDDTPRRVLEAMAIYCWPTSTGYAGAVSTVHNLTLAVDKTSPLKMATLYSMDLNNDSGVAGGDSFGDMDVLVVQGAMVEIFTGVSSQLVPRTLRGFGMGLGARTDGVIYNDIAAGPLQLAIAKDYTLVANGRGMEPLSVVSAIMADLEAGKGVDFAGLIVK